MHQPRFNALGSSHPVTVNCMHATKLIRLVHMIVQLWRRGLSCVLMQQLLWFCNKKTTEFLWTKAIMQNANSSMIQWSTNCATAVEWAWLWHSCTRCNCFYKCCHVVGLMMQWNLIGAVDFPAAEANSLNLWELARPSPPENQTVFTQAISQTWSWR